MALGASSGRLLFVGGQVSSIGSDPRWDIILRWLISRWRLEEVAFLLLPFQTAASLAFRVLLEASLGQ